uniref:Uncharacterized protein n=2 Tax=Cryptomonas curvata TaxID=233186 RepID=A0A7S0QG51_9CRYP
MFAQKREAKEQEMQDAAEESKDKARGARLAARLAGLELHSKWSEMEDTAHLESADGQDADGLLNFEPLPTDQAAAAPTLRLSINENDLLLGGLSCPALLPLRVIQLADLACITKLTLTEIEGISGLDLAMFMPLEGL